LTYEKIDGPAAALATALEAHEIDEANFWTLEPGEARSIR
jgi:hypothetical protein